MSRKKNFEREADVRKWWRDECARIGEWGTLIWVEARSGGTFGAPDLWYPLDGVVYPVELKFGTFVDGWIQITLRRDQRDLWAVMGRHGVTVWCFVGLEGGRRTVVCRGMDIITGKTKAYVEITGIEQVKQVFKGEFGEVPSSTFPLV